MKWKLLNSTPLFSESFFKLRSDRCQLPDGRIMPKYFVLEFSDWVNILPVTPNGRLLMVRQYRQASGLIHLEIPGGSLDPRLNETPEQGALREMEEETGFTSSNIIHVGSHYPNPALQNNRMHTFLALNAVKVRAPQWDEFEAMELYECSVEQLQKHILDGDVSHSLMLASLFLCLQRLKKENP